ncbi:unnamed protein product [Scytosiphon promiscuus]
MASRVKERNSRRFWPAETILGRGGDAVPVAGRETDTVGEGPHRGRSKTASLASKYLLGLHREDGDNGGETRKPRLHRRQRTAPDEAGVAGAVPPPANRAGDNDRGAREKAVATEAREVETGTGRRKTAGQLAALLRALEATSRATPSATLRSYAEAGKWELALGLLRRMMSGSPPSLSPSCASGVRPDSRSFGIAVSACARAGRWREVTDLVLREMPASGVTPAAPAYREALDACSRSGRWEEAVRLLDGMVGAGLDPGVAAYNGAITLCGSAGRSRVAVGLLDRMRAAGVRPNVSSYNSALTACAHAGERQQALELLARMRTGGAGEASPDVRSYNTAIRAVGGVGDCDAASSLLREMSAAGVVPNTDSYSSVVSAFVQAGRADDPAVPGLLEEMSESKAGASVDRITICGVELHLGASGGGRGGSAASWGERTSKNWRQAVGLAREVEGSVTRASATDRSRTGETGVRDGSERSESSHDDAGSGSGSGLPRDGALGEQWLLSGETDSAVGISIGRDDEGSSQPEALARLRGMSGAEMPQTVGNYSLAITKCGHEGRWQDALALLRRMPEAAGVPPSRKCYHSAIGACGSSDRYEEALALLREMPERGLSLTEKSYRCAISACGNAGRFDECVSLLREARAAGLPPSPGSYSLAIMACGDAGRWETGLSLLEEAEALDIVANGACYNAAAKACKDCGRPEEAAGVLERSRRRRDEH